jgi:O-antigen ligase
MRYPIFLLAFGPPVFKSGVTGDTSHAHFDIWNVLQVSWLSIIALRAVLRLTNTQSILIPKQVRSILKLFFILGLLFIGSVSYSSGRVISAEYCVLYFMNLICVVEFIVDVYKTPPNWMECIFQLRLVSLILIGVVLLTLLFNPSLVMTMIPGIGIRMLGGFVASMTLYPEMVAIISAYCFVHSLEPRFKSAVLFLVGIAGSAITQTRGVAVSLSFVLFLILIGWGIMGRRSVYLLVSGLMLLALASVAVIATFGGERILQTFSRGQDVADVATLSGRTGVWLDIIKYSISHPQGMGYISGVRTFHRSDYATNLHATLNRMGGTDNAYMETLADAGWLALALYLTVIVRVIAIGWRFAKRVPEITFASDRVSYHPLRCTLLLFVFCLSEGMESSMFAIPMFGSFYCQYILIAIILGLSGNILGISRTRHSPLFAR